jgi:hypothetical protein
MRRRASCLAVLLLALTACAHSTVFDAAGVRREFGDLLSPRFDPATISSRDSSELRQIFAALRGTRSAARRFDAITGVTFESATRARVAFTWSGGMHGGFFILQKQDGTWRITEDAWLV